MITIFKIGRTTFVLSNRQITPNSPVFIGEILHREEEEIPPVAVVPQMPVTTKTTRARSYNCDNFGKGKRRHLDAALERIKKFKNNDPRVDICQGYGRFASLHVGQTSHSSAMAFLKGNKFPCSNGMVYNLIAWAVTHCELGVTNTYPMKYVRGGDK